MKLDEKATCVSVTQSTVLVF